MRRFFASILALITVLPGPIRAADDKTSQLNKISVVTAEDEVVVRLVGTKSPDFTTYTQRDPFRVVVDWSGSRFVGQPEEQSVGPGLIRRIRTKQIESESEHISRVTIELALETAFRFETEGRAVLVRFKKIEVPPPEPIPSEAPASAAPSPSPSVAQLPDGPLTEPTDLPKPPPKPPVAPAPSATPSPSPSKTAVAVASPAPAPAPAGAQKLGAFVPEGRTKESPRPLASLSPKPSASPGVAASSPAPAAPTPTPSPLASLSPRPSPSPAAPTPTSSPSPSPLASLKPSPSPSPVPLASLSPSPKPSASPAVPSPSPSPLASLKPSPSPAAERPAPVAVAPRAAPSSPAPAPTGKITLAEHKPSPAAAPVAESADYDRGARKMTYVGFRQKSETSEVFVRVDGRARYKVEQPAPDRVVVELFDTRVNVKNNERALDTSYFNSAVTRIQAVPSAHSTRIEIDLRDNVPYEVKRIGTTISLEFKLPEG